jgi:hypothetical protein
MADAEVRDEIKFTRNMVVLEVRGASVNLTVIDLGGPRARGGHGFDLHAPCLAGVKGL